MNIVKNSVWSTENLVLFGMWLVKQGKYGHGLLCIHGACLGVKVGTLLKLKWGDFLDYTLEDYLEEDDIVPSKTELRIGNEKKDAKRIYPLNYFLQSYTRKVYFELFEGEDDVECFGKNIYVHSKTGKVLTTSSLNKELNRYYEQFNNYVKELTGFGLNLRELKTNSMEIAWGRDMVKKYGYSKKAFIELSKYMGHRTVTDTINLLEIEPVDEIEFSYNFFNPTHLEMNNFENMVTNEKELTDYISNQGEELIYISSEHYFKKN